MIYNQGLTDRNCPVREDGIYFSYDEFKDNKYEGNVRGLVNFRVAEYKQVFKEDDRYVEIEKGVMLDTQAPESYNVIHLAWATNILPDEIDLDDVNAADGGRTMRSHSLAGESENLAFAATKPSGTL